MRRVGYGLLVALAAAGCTTTPQTVPGAAAPVTATGRPPATRPPATPAPGSPATPAPGSPTSPAPAAPLRYATLTATGFGVSVALPVPADWTRTPTRTAGRTRTDVDLADPAVTLRIDLTARAQGSARDGALSNEKTSGLTGYHRLDIAAVPGVGDDAVDWAFTFEKDGTRQAVDRQIQQGPAAVAVYYAAPQDVFQRYLPVWQNAVRKLTIRSS